MSERQVTPYSHSTVNEISDVDPLQELAWAASGELGDDKKWNVGNIISDQLRSNDPKEITEALQVTGHFLKHQTEIFDVAYDVVDKELDRLVEISDCGDETLELQAMQTIYDAWMGSGQDNPRIIAVFKSLLPKIIAHYPKNNKKLPFQSLAQEFIDDFTRPSTTDQINFALRLSYSDCQHIGKTRQERRTTKLMDNDILDAFGYDQSTAVLAEYWQDGMKKTRRKNDTAHAMQVMAALETAEPGMVNSLNKNNGIRNFQRYTPDTLHQIHQDQIEHPDKDYVLLIQAVSDHNDAFKQPNTYSNLHARLKKMGYGLRIYECGDLDELDEITEKVLRNYTNHGAKVVSELILGHGSVDSVKLGSYQHAQSITRLTARHLDRTIHANIADAMTKDASTRFISCSTGKETKGRLCISKETAIAMGKIAIAPTANVSFGNMRPIKNGDGVNVMVDYLARKGKRNGKAHYVRSSPAIFNGKTEQSQRRPQNDHDREASSVWDEWDIHPLDSPLIEFTDLTDELPSNDALIYLEPEQSITLTPEL